MEYLKPLVEFIPLDEMDVIVTSGGCEDSSGGGDTCSGSNPDVCKDVAKGQGA